MAFQLSSLRRLWQPRHPLFWLVVGLQLLSSSMTAVLHVLQPQGPLRAALVLFAFFNTLAGWWLLARLWRETAPPTGEKHV
ncbi:MAG: hypothetical protein ACLGG8_06955 [Gammaproteobacteria bacterium]